LSYASLSSRVCEFLNIPLRLPADKPGYKKIPPPFSIGIQKNYYYLSAAFFKA